MEIKAGELTFYEFFAGGGMARAGLGRNWSCLFANDFDAKKGQSYTTNWGANEFRVGDVALLAPSDLPGVADLAWASFPCQDLSLAGAGAGLNGERSGTFWPFWRLIETLDRERRAPKVVALENVCGALTSHDGRDFVAIGTALTQLNYRFGAVVIDAVNFVPQSRPRLFVLAVRKDALIPDALSSAEPLAPWHTQALCTAHEKLSALVKKEWVWWRLPPPPVRQSSFVDLIEDEPRGVVWHTRAETDRLLDLMSPIHRSKVAEASKAGRRMIGGVYRRTRPDKNGQRVQRAEIRFDDIAGCLRTPVGGSSRQLIMIVDGNSIRSRLLSPREASRLMGLPDSYKLPERHSDAYHLTGDGLVVPVVRFVAANLLERLLGLAEKRREAA